MAGEYSSGGRLEVGSRIRGYRVERVFDPGQFAFASEAIAEGGRRVFLKKYKQPGMYSEWYDTFGLHQREVRGRIASDSVARTLCDEFIECFSHEKVEAAGRKRALYVVYGLIEGALDLARHLASAVVPDQAELGRRLTFARVLVAAVHAVHRCGITHADLKPENVMLIRDPSVDTGFRVRLIDFDFSLLHGKAAPWHGHISVGTPGYWSPEHLRGDVPGPASDVFTCGVMIIQMLTGRHPCADRMDRFDELARSGGLSPGELPETLPLLGDSNLLATVLGACLRPDPVERPSARQLLEALNGKLVSFEGIASRAESAGHVGAARDHLLRVGAPGQPMEVIRTDCVVDDAFLRTWYPASPSDTTSPALLRFSRNGRGRWSVGAAAGAEIRIDGGLLSGERELPVGRTVLVGLTPGRVLAVEVDPMPSGSRPVMIPP